MHFFLSNKKKERKKEKKRKIEKRKRKRKEKRRRKEKKRKEKKKRKKNSISEYYFVSQLVKEGNIYCRPIKPVTENDSPLA